MQTIPKYNTMKQILLNNTMNNSTQFPFYNGFLLSHQADPLYCSVVVRRTLQESILNTSQPFALYWRGLLWYWGSKEKVNAVSCSGQPDQRKETATWLWNKLELSFALCYFYPIMTWLLQDRHYTLRSDIIKLSTIIYTWPHLRLESCIHYTEEMRSVIVV